MKKLLAIVVIIMLCSCNSQKMYENFDISYARSGGFAPIYENVLIKGNKMHYSFDGHGKKTKEDFAITNAEIKNILNILKQNNFRFIESDHLKMYDNITTTINVKIGEEAAVKNDGSGIMAKDQQKWQNITTAFRSLIDSKLNSSSAK